MQKNVLEYLDISAKKFPNKVAYTDEQKEITFKQLEDYSKNIGTQIIQKTEKINTPIVVFVDRNVDSLIAFFGILYSGNFYVPIDNKMPVERIKKVFEKVNPSLILYNNNDKELFDIVKEGYKGLEINYINGIKIDDERINARRKKVLDIDPVYVIFTSGSTGTPKGIVIAHKNVIDFTDWMVNAIGFDENDVMANQAPFYFDLSVKDIYVTLKVGATMHILTRKQLMFPILLVKYLDEKNVTSLIWATSAFNLIANSKVLDSVVPKHINKIVLGGEALMARNLNIWKSKLPNVKFVNLYGPTEVTVDCTYYIIDKEYSDEEEIPIGVACENKEVLLLNENSEEVPQGTVGEICVRGTGVAKGYFNDNEKTDKVFIQNPLNNCYRDIIYRTGDMGVKNEKGLIYFKSRMDGQIKHMGYRIELGEIERAINSIGSINSVACLYDAKKDKIVCVYEGKTTNQEIIAHIQKLIPKYMFPNIIYNVEKMPYNANGKIDRVKLKECYILEDNK